MLVLGSHAGVVGDARREDVFQLRPNIGFDGLTLKSPKGLVQGQSMAVLLRPNVSDMSMAAFDRMPEIIARGENSARSAERDLACYSASPKVFAAYQKRKQVLRKHLTYLQSGAKVDDIVIVN